ncbi:putative ankyrin repeat protein RF_0381 [Saccostrea cucullata]|uniref:putative ankyrin repeat protein RF_0381 n=1 Tax=Saccostrea cuccullata TaxID=36930 RepID=UPI002ED03F7E
MTSRLLEAIELNNLEAVRALLNDREHCKHYDVNEGLCMAAKNGYYEIIQELFRSPLRKPSVQYVDENQKRAFEYAVISGDRNAVDFLLKAGAFINWSDDEGFQPLHFAAQCGNVAMINFLIENGSHIYSARTNREGLTPFHIAVDYGHIEAVEAFIESRTVSVNMKTKLKQGGQTPLHRAVLKSHLKIIELLVEKGACIDTKDSEGRQAIHYAAQADDPNVLEYILNQGANIDVTENCGRRAIHYAIYNNQEENVKTLLNYGADIHAKDENAYLPLYSGVMIENPKIVKCLLLAGADPNECNRVSRQDYALLMAVSLGNTEIVRILLDAGADPNVLGFNRATALHKCQKLKNKEERDAILALLIKSGAKMNPMDRDGYTPLHSCVMQSVLGNFSLTTMKILIQAGSCLYPERLSPSESQIRVPASPNSPLCFLVWRGFLEAAEYLLHCGWDISHETWMYLPGKTTEQTRFHQWMIELTSSVRPLSSICRQSIRRHLLECTKGSEILTSIENLPLPPSIKKYLSYQDQ